MAVKRTQLEERYELRQILGQGGMGVVYQALDRLMQREVALKTIIDIDDETMAMFYNEWNLLANMVHPNVISIYDIGEFQHEGTKKPFFVMPLLPGVTLDRLIRDGSPKLSVTGVLGIIEQACRGLHAAHQQGLIHRDVKPSNLFVMEDSSVKVIDFGIARTASGTNSGAMRGTYPYMAPEQFARKPPTPLSDLFSLAVVTYQALTGRRPFLGIEDEVIDAIQRVNPAPISGLNRDVNFGISQVVAKALAKQPRHRFLNMLEFAEALQKASRNEPLEWFDTGKVKSRLERAAKSFEQGDYVFATEVLSELEGEGHLDQEITLLRGQVDSAARQNRIRQLLESARRFFEATEYALALLKIQEALELDRNHPDTLALQGQIEKKRRETKISEWIELARQHLDNHAFRQAREALDHVLQLRPNDTVALGLLAEVGRQEQQLAEIREEKSRVYQAAKRAWESGEVTSALSRLEVLIGMDRENPESDSGPTYQSFYNLVHSEHNALKNAYEEARRHLDTDDFDAARAVSQQYLSKYPNHALFQALLFDVENRQRQKLSAAVADADRRVQAERDLDRRAGILVEALKLYPNEPHFEGALQSVRDKRDLVNAIIAKARYFEEQGQLTEALDQWQILKSIHSEQPELAFELPRLMKRREQQVRENSHARLVELIGKYVEDGDYDRAALTAQNALVEFPADAELLELQTQVVENQERGRKAMELLASAQDTGEDGSLEQSIELLRAAHLMDSRSTVIRTVLVNSLLDRGRRLVDSDWQAAEDLLREVRELEPNCAPAENLASRIESRKKPKLPANATAQPEAKSTPTDSHLRTDPTAASPSAPQLIRPVAEPTVTLRTPSVERAAEARDAADQPSSEAANIPSAPSSSLGVWPSSLISMRNALAAMLQANSEAGSRRNILYGLLAVLAAVVVLSVALATRHSRPPVAPPANFRVTLISSRLGAQIKFNGRPCAVSICELTLAAGTYRAEADLAGYLPAIVNFSVSADRGVAGPIELNLVPAPPLITISTDLPEGVLLVDGAAAGQIRDGGVEVARLILGSHEIAVQSGELWASFILEIGDGTAPRISPPIQAKGVRVFAIVAASSGSRAYSSENNTKATLDGHPVGDLVVEGLELKDASAGTHELAFTGPSGQDDKMVFESKPFPAVYVKMSLSTRKKP